jgi:hypothetical protein
VSDPEPVHNAYAEQWIGAPGETELIYRTEIERLRAELQRCKAESFTKLGILRHQRDVARSLAMTFEEELIHLQRSHRSDTVAP